MKNRALLTIFILALVLLMITGSCATSPGTQEEREGVDQEVFFQSIRSSNYAEVKKHIEAGVDVNAQDKDGFTVLMIASGLGNTEVARLLIEAGADVNTKPNIGVTALGFASTMGNTDIVRLLIDKGADVNAQTSDGTTLLMYALQYGHLTIAKLLIEERINVDVRNKKGQTALMFASQYGHIEVAKLIIEEGVDVNARGNQGETALIYASQYGQPDAARLLIEKGADVNAQSNQGVTALMTASYVGHLDVVQLLIEAGSDVNAEAIDGHTALMLASSKGHKEIVELLNKAAIEYVLEASMSGEESTYLPFRIEEKLVDEIRNLFSSNDFTSKSYTMILNEQMVIPDRVTYIPLTVHQNQKTVDDFFNYLEVSSVMEEMQGDSVIICGAHLTSLLKRSGLLPTLEYVRIAGMCKINLNQHVLIECGIKGDSIPKVLKLVRNLLFSGGSITVRKLNERELDWYWTIISYDITEPIFVFENRYHKVMIDFTEDAKIFYVDLFDNLEWGNE